MTRISSLGEVSVLANTGSRGSGIAVDSFGNVYVANYSEHKIVKIDPSGNLTNFAGSGSAGDDNGQKDSATFDGPRGLAVDSSGNLYVADYNNHLIRKIDNSGQVTIYAGSGDAGSEDGSAGTASFDGPFDVEFDSNGNLYVADFRNQRIRKIDLSGEVTTVAGNGTEGSQDGKGSQATFNYPRGIAVDSSGNVFVSDTGNHKVRSIEQVPYETNFIVTFSDAAGNSGMVDNTTDGSGVTVDLEAPTLTKVEVSSTNTNTQGQLEQLAKEGDTITLTVESSEALKSLSVMGSDGSPTPLTAVGNTGREWTLSDTVDSDDSGELSFTLAYEDLAGNAGTSVSDTTNNSRVSFDTTVPTLISVSLASNNVSTNRAKSGDNLTLSFTSSEPIPVPTVTLAGSTITATSGNGTDWQAVHPVGNNTPNGSASFSISFVDEAGNVGTAVTTTTDQSSVNVDTTTPTLTLVKLKSNNSDNPSLAKFRDTVTLEFDASETIEAPSVRINGIESTVSYGSDTDWMAIYIIPEHRSMVATFAGSSSGSANDVGTLASFKRPEGLALDSFGNTYIADTHNHLIRKIDPSGNVTTFAGSGSPGSTNANGTSASFYYPQGIAVDLSGNVYVTDNFNHLIRKIDPSGDVTTFAGSGSPGSTNAQGTSASFKNPADVAVDRSGNVYVTDRLNHLIRKIDSNGNVTTLAGSGSPGSTNAKGTSASFNKPFGIDVDAFGNVYIGDQVNNLIRKIDFSGNVTTFAGSGIGGNDDGQGTEASFNQPTGIAIDSSGNIFVTDLSNDSIRKIDSTGKVSTVAGGNTGFQNGSGIEAKFNEPYNLDVDFSGNLFVSDGRNNKIRKINLVGETINFRVDFADAAGNSGSIDNTTDNSLVKVDLEDPVISNVSITSTNQDPNWAKYGDNVTLSFSTNEPIQDPTDNISVDGLTGIVVVGNDDKTEWTATGQVASNVSGMANYSISVKDHAGNVATPVTSTTSINLDTESPSLNNVVLTTSNTNTSFAKAGDNLTLTFNASELIETPVVTLAGTNVDVQDTNSGAGTSWQATYTVQDGDNGTVAFSIQYQDQAGNTDDNVTTTDLGNLITLDTSNPVVVASSVTITSTNTTTATEGLKWARKNETVILSFDTNERVESPKLNLNGKEIGALSRSMDTTGTLWEARYTVEDVLGNLMNGGNLSLWLDAKNIDGNHNNTLVDGTSVTSWMDVRNSGRYLSTSSMTGSVSDTMHQINPLNLMPEG